MLHRCRMAAVVVGTFCVLATTACGGVGGRQESPRGCPAYVDFPSVQAAAGASDLVASGALASSPIASASDQWLFPIRLDEVKKGDPELSGQVVNVPFDASCGDPVPTFPAFGTGSGGRVIVFLVGSSADGWKFLTPAQGVVPSSQATLDEINPRNS